MGECSNRWLRKSDESKLQGLRVLGDDVKSVTVMNIGYGFGDNSHGGELDPRASQGSRKKKKSQSNQKHTRTTEFRMRKAHFILGKY